MSNIPTSFSTAGIHPSSSYQNGNATASAPYHTSRQPDASVMNSNLQQAQQNGPVHRPPYNGEINPTPQRFPVRNQQYPLHTRPVSPYPNTQPSNQYMNQRPATPYLKNGPIRLNGAQANHLPPQRQSHPSPTSTHQYQTQSPVHQYQNSSPGQTYSTGPNSQAPIQNQYMNTQSNVQQPNNQSYQNYPQKMHTANHRYPNANHVMEQPPNMNNGVQEANKLMGRLSVEQSLTYPVNLLEQKQLVSTTKQVPPKPPLSQETQKKNANPDIMRCTMNAIPQTSNLMKQCKLPFSIYIHPFKENMNHPVVTSVITRCRSCRSYLNPFVSIPDNRRWQCNMCYRMNDLPDELMYDYNSRRYTDIRKRPELSHASVEFVAPSEYMLRPPQPSIFIFVLDVTFTAINTGYLTHFCEILKEQLGNLPGDNRTKIGFVTFNSSVHFYSLKDSQSQPQMHSITDLDDVFLPVPDGLLVNLKESKEMILQLLDSLPEFFAKSIDSKAATGAALQAARKMVASSGGRITLFQTCLPAIGPGALKHRDAYNVSGNSKDAQHLNPSIDFYKKLALECAGEQIGIDIFLLAGQFTDLASTAAVSRYSSGSIHYFPMFHATKNQPMLEKFQNDFKRYLTREIGFEAVMRLRCTKGLSIHTFHGNFFVRSTDLLSLPNVNPDHSFSMQIEIEESLEDSNMAAFQAALLYTTTKGERRIRVHTLALPVTSKLSDIYAYADQEAVANALSKLAVDRALTSSIGDAREALMNACIDCLKVYRNEVSGQRNSSSIFAPYHLRLMPLYIMSIMKNDAFKLGSGVPLDSRVFNLLEFKFQPIFDSLLKIYPQLYSLADICSEDEEVNSNPPIYNASAEKLSRTGIYVMDTGKMIYLFVGRSAPQGTIQELFNIPGIESLPEVFYALPELNNGTNVLARRFIEKLRKQRHFYSSLEIIREDSKQRITFLNKLLDDKSESAVSYIEFLQHLQRQING